MSYNNGLAYEFLAGAKRKNLHHFRGAFLNEDGTMELTVQCPFGRGLYKVMVDYNKAMAWLRNDCYAVEAVLSTTLNDAELLKTGIDPGCWEEMFANLGED